MSWLAT
jgi:hypothetical protein